MGSIFKKPKKPDTSKQQALIKQQQDDLKRQQAEAKAEADALRDKRIAGQKRLRGRLAGRRSLISGSELGTTEKLGGNEE